MTPDEAIAFVEEHGIVLESASLHALPCLVEAIAGETLGGRWWAHPRGREIFALTRAVRASTAIATCRLVEGRITFVHARCWPALARIGGGLPGTGLARIGEIHTAQGRHRVEERRFPDWLPAQAVASARDLTPDEARATLALPSFLYGQRS
ncbi:hypothetical protein [Dokdonella sp.]|uniref:hypothetical protein n=1 Tax=Dokdonella sp. TaxID=2291710 RepID=UPI001B0B52CC|nr:hypothetical protein [Dokdonella sp.]MBO9663817.1 hypothetical protein [Dokdonella sp.]